MRADPNSFGVCRVQPIDDEVNKSVGSRCSLTCRQRSPRKREDDLLPDMEQQGGSRDVSPLNAQDAIPHCPATKKKPPQFRNYDGSAYEKTSTLCGYICI